MATIGANVTKSCKSVRQLWGRSLWAYAHCRATEETIYSPPPLKIPATKPIINVIRTRMIATQANHIKPLTTKPRMARTTQSTRRNISNQIMSPPGSSALVPSSFPSRSIMMRDSPSDLQRSWRRGLRHCSSCSATRTWLGKLPATAVHGCTVTPLGAASRDSKWGSLSGLPGLPQSQLRSPL